MQLNVTSLSTLTRLSTVQSSAYFHRDSSEGIFARLVLSVASRLSRRIAPREIALFPRTFVVV